MSEAIRLRAHQVLCLQGFRGLGYSPEFVDAFTSVHEFLAANPDREVELLTSPDGLCQVCPHHRPGTGCTLGGPHHEDHMRRQDEDVLARLDLAAGQRIRWAELVERIRLAIRGGDLRAICTTCPWLPLGYCAQGIDDLRR